MASPMRILAWMILFSPPGGTMPGSGLSFPRMSAVTSAPSVSR
jgi:hypothetical protein